MCAYLAATRPAFLISTSLRFRKISRRRSVWPFGGEEPTRNISPHPQSAWNRENEIELGGLRKGWCELGLLERS